MRFDAQTIQAHTATLGFRSDVLEKVFRLLGLLEALRAHPFLRPRIALKGGTALNLFLLDVPRLSVDIDLNYLGSADRDGMLAERPSVEQAIQDVCRREQLAVRYMPSEHAGGKWILSFTNTAGASDKLEVDLNFLLRLPLWPVNIMDSKAMGSVLAQQIAVVDRHELAAGKLAALCSRNASRDLFDARELFRVASFDRVKLRLAFVLYGAWNRKDWREIRVEDISAETSEVKRELVPMLRLDLRPKDRELAAWTEMLIREVREQMALLLPLDLHEKEFIGRLNDSGVIAPELLTEDPMMQERIRVHPGLQWKALNVQKHRG